MRKFHLFISALLLTSGLTNCTKEDIGLTDSDILQNDKTNIQSYAQTKGLMGSMTASGVYYAPNKLSSSTVSPTEGMEAEFNYTLYALSGSAPNVTDFFVDSTYATKSSYAYIIATNQGLTEGLLRMHEGDQSILILPSVYAFGRSGAGNGIIPANTPVRLNLTLKRARTEDQQINDYLTANKLTPTEVTNTGLRFIKTLDNPAGVKPTPTQTLTIKYRGQLLRSVSAFDSTGSGTYSGLVTGFVPGFAEGLAKLKVGEKATILFPSRIGYGSTGYSIIPAYAPLRFDIELVSAL